MMMMMMSTKRWLAIPDSRWPDDPGSRVQWLIYWRVCVCVARENVVLLLGDLS